MFHLTCFITCTDTCNICNCIRTISEGNNRFKLLCMVLLQNGIELDLKQYITKYTFIKTYHVDKIIPLSQARNLLISNCQIEESAYYMFPDDDSTFDISFFDNFERNVCGNTLISVKASQDKVSYFVKMPDRRYSRKIDYHYAISVNMIITGKTLLQVGKFDEELGVGNYYGSGEDNDFFIRCNAIEPFTFSNELWNYHPLQKDNLNLPLNKLILRYKSYGRGIVYMLIKHKMICSIMTVIIRGYCGCIYNILKLNFRMSYVYFLAANARLYTFIKNINKIC